MQAQKRDWKNMILTEINPLKTCLIIIDMQNLFITPGYSLYCEMGAKTIPKLNDFARRCRERGIHVIYTRSPGDRFNAEGGAGDIPAGIDVRAGDTILVKYRYSSFYCTNLDIIVQERGVDTVLIAGVCTEACCFSTARDAGFRGMKIGFLADLTGTIDYPDLGYGSMTAQEMHNATLCNIALTTAHVMESEKALELMR